MRPSASSVLRVRDVQLLVGAVALRGAGAVVVAGTPMPLDPEHLVRADAGVDRVLTSGPEGLRVLCVGSTPGAPYEAPH